MSKMDKNGWLVVLLINKHLLGLWSQVCFHKTWVSSSYGSQGISGFRCIKRTVGQKMNTVHEHMKEVREPSVNSK